MKRILAALTLATVLAGAALAAPAKIVRVILERQPCFRTCPVYTLTLNADGTAVYKGTRFVPHLGLYRGTFWAGELDGLAPFLDKWKFWSMNDGYRSLATDQSTQILTIVTDKGKKTVREYGRSGPSELWALQKLVDGIAANVDWKKAR